MHGGREQALLQLPLLTPGHDLVRDLLVAEQVNLAVHQEKNVKKFQNDNFGSLIL